MPGVTTVFDSRAQDSRLDGLAAAAGTVRAGRLVVFPTDTVYGIGCDAFSGTAVQSLLHAKGRPPGTPVGVLIGSWATVDGLVLAMPPSARLLMEAFWPGSLSMVLPQAPSLAWDLGNARGTVTVRMPLHPVALELLREVGPMAVSMASHSGSDVSGPTATCQSAREQLGDTVSVYLDAGELSGESTSTVVDVTGTEPRLLREGPITAAQLSEVLGWDISVES
jgi:L-threonylcarbamoyladenylate synthase